MRRPLLAFIAALLVLPACAHAAAEPASVGFNDLSATGSVPADQAAFLTARTGATRTRMVIDWSWIEYEDDRFSWGLFDAMYWRSLDHGVRPLIGVTGAPRWAWEPDATCSASHCAHPPGAAFDADYAQFVSLLAQRYRHAAAIEVGNEPNMTWAWAGGPDPARYTELLKLAHAAVKAVDPNMPVIGGALAPIMTDGSSSQWLGLRPFLQAMYDNGARGHMDALSVHPYPYDVDFGKAFMALSVAKETRTVNGDDVPLWVTETGMSSTGGFTEYEQGIAVPNLVSALRGDPEIDAIFVHSLVESPNAEIVAERGYGAVRADLSPKPVYCALTTLLQGPYSCPKKVAKANPTGTQVAHWQAQVLLQAAADAARKVHVARGSYAGLTAADLHAVDARISPVAANGDRTPGSTAEPSQIGVWPGLYGADGVLLCNTSKGTTSYCISTFWRGPWRYGSAVGSLYAAAGATNNGSNPSW